MSFAAGFYGRVADNMADKKAFIRNRVEEDRTYLRQQGLQRQAAVAEQRGRYQMATEQLLRIQGVDRNTVLAALEADPDGVLDLAGRDYTNGSEINTVLEIYKDSDPTSTNLTDILNSVMPAVSALPADSDPTTVRRTGIAAWLGLDTETELNQQVYSAQVVGGMTGDQILASMNVPVRAQGSGSRGMNYEAVEDPLTSGEKTYAFSEITPEYDTLLEEKIAATKAAFGEREGTPTTKEFRDHQAEVERLEALKKGSDSSRMPGLLQEFGATDNAMAYWNDPLFGGRLFGPTMARFFETTSDEDDLNATAGSATAPEITTTEIPEVTPILEVEDAEEAEVKVNEFFEDPINEGTNEVVVVVDGRRLTLTRPEEPYDGPEAGSIMIGGKKITVDSLAGNGNE